jgi:hypothetical protein
MHPKILFIIILLSGSISLNLGAKTYNVYYLGGQSNMVGFGHNKALSSELSLPLKNIPIFSGAPKVDEDPRGGDGAWTILQPGFGLGYDFVDGHHVYSDRFGPELTFAREMQKLAPDENIAIIKYAWGGTALVDGVSAFGSWDPFVTKLNQYDYFLKVVDEAMSTSDIDGDGEIDVLIPSGIVWMQGEADAYDDKHAADSYLENLTTMVHLIRAAFRENNLPVVIGRITDSKADEDTPVMKYSQIVRESQEAFTRQDPFADLSTITEQLNYPDDDEWHYDTEGYLLMGKDFARLIHAIRSNPSPEDND